MTHYGPVIGDRDGLRVIDCRACGYAHLERLPAESELEKFYQSEFWQLEKSGWLDRYLAQREWMTATHSGWLELCASHALGDKLLDVGSGYGFFCEDALRNGWSTVNGIELSHEACDYARIHIKDVEFYCESWTDRQWQGQDVISALWLIEHLPNPLEFLQWAKAALIPGGILLLAVPNDFTSYQMFVNGHASRPYWWIDKTHLNYFTPSAIANLLGLAEFRIVERQTLADMTLFLKNSANDYTSDPAIGDRLHARNRAFDLSMTMNERLLHYGYLARQGLGREIILIAKSV